MSDPAVTAFLTKLLCSHGGRLERDRLAGCLDLPEQQIEQILLEESGRFPQSANIVLARTSVKICHSYLFRPQGCPEGEGQCPKLHLCRHYLRARCPPNRRPPCRFSHDIQSDHNRAVLKANLLSGLNEDELRTLLFQNDSALLPEDCSSYMRGGCDQGEECPRLHLCRYFGRGECYNRFCRKSHNMLDSRVLGSCAWLSKESIQNLQMLCVLKHQERHEARDKDTTWAPQARQRGRGRGRGRGRRDGSYDLLEGRSRERRSDVPHSHQPSSSSRPSSACSWGQPSGDQDLYDSDSDHSGRQAKLDSLMSDWFGISTTYSHDTHAESSATNPRPAARPDPVMPSTDNQPKPLTAKPETPTGYTSTANVTVAPASTSKVNHVPSYKATALPNATGPPSAYPLYVERRLSPHYVTQKPPTAVGPSKPLSPLSAEPPKVPPTPVPRTSMNPSTEGLSPEVRLGPPLVPQKPPTAVGPSKPLSPLSAEPPKVPPRTVSHTSMNPPTEGLSPEVRVSPKSSTTPSEVSITRSPSVTTQYNKSVSSPTAGPYNTPSTASSSLSYPNIHGPSAAQLKPAECYWGSSSSSLNSSNSMTGQSFVATGDNLPYRKLASVKQLTKSDTQPFKEMDEQLKKYDGPLPKPPTSSTDSQPLSTTSVPSVTASVKETPVICLANIWKHCKLGGRCPDMHYYLPYRWQVQNSADWEDLPNMEDLEKAYSDPKNDRHQFINFQIMRDGVKHVRRLSTPSSVTQPSEYVLTTEWVWYWKDEFGNWIQYGQMNTKSMSANILTRDLENIYLSDPTDTISFSAGEQRYILNFKDMTQRNTRYQTVKEVRRRPIFQDFENVKMLKGSTKSAAKLAASPLRVGSYPTSWNLEVMPDSGYKKLLVSEASGEFSGIATLFNRTITGFKIKRLWRIQNPALWEVYQWQKNQMKKKNNSGLEVRECQLFHGTTSTNTEQICTENFDWRVCGTNGTVYGQGSYFARDASYSHNYAAPTSSGTRTMFVARVLVGNFVKGDSTMRRPPLKYDSCVDNVANPSIYVVFEKHQIYPEYVLEYAEEKRSCSIS